MFNLKDNYCYQLVGEYIGNIAIYYNLISISIVMNYKLANNLQNKTYLNIYDYNNYM